LTYLQLDEPGDDAVQCDPLGSESVWRDGSPVGQISSGGYGYATGAYLAYAYIRPQLNRVGNEFEVLVMGEPRRAVIVEQCVYDPENLLPRSED
jgi:dimethylglycine dehydrogenase